MFYQNTKRNLYWIVFIKSTTKRIIFALSFFTLIVNADTNDLTLTLAVKQALQQNPTLKVYPLKKQGLLGEYQTANLKPQYKLNIETEQFAGTGELSGIDSLETTVSLSSVVEMGGKRQSRTGIIASKRSVLETKQQIAALSLLGDVTRKYVTLLAIQQQQSLANEALNLTTSALKIVKNRSKAGVSPAFEVDRAIAAQAKAELTLASIEQQLEYRKISLAAMWGDTRFSYNKLDGDLFSFGNDIDFDSLYARVAQNPMIQLFAAKERLSQSIVRLAKTESTADVSWSIGLRQTQETSDTSLVAGFSMPLISSDRNRGAITTALAKQNEVYIQKDIAILTMHAQLFRAFNNRKQAIRTVRKLKQIIIPSLEKSMLATLKAYQQGRYSYLETVSARQELLSAKRTLIDAAQAALKYGAEIEQLTAEPLAASNYALPEQYKGLQK